jgi:hypothetical protein
MNDEARIRSYLDAHRSGIRFLTVDQIIGQVKLGVFFGASPISDDEIRQIVLGWSILNPVLTLPGAGPGGPAGNPPPASPPSADNSDLIDAVKKAITVVTKPIRIGKESGNIEIGVSGLTANLKKGDSSLSLGMSWGSSVVLEAESGPFHFSGEVSKEKWEIKLSFPEDTAVPDLSKLGKIFSEGQSAVSKIAVASAGWKGPADSGRVGALIKPSVEAVQDAVEAASGIAKADRKGGMSFGFKVGSPSPLPGQTGMPPGFETFFVVIYWF